MKNIRIGVELKQHEVDSVSGGTAIEVYGAIGTALGIAAIYFIVDPLLSYFRGK